MSTVLDKAQESHTEFLSRRSSQMAGMIGLLSSRLEIIDMNLKFDMQYDTMTPDLWRRTASQDHQDDRPPRKVDFRECLGFCVISRAIPTQCTKHTT